MSQYDTESLEFKQVRNEQAKRRVYITGLLLVSAVLLCAWLFRTPSDIYREVTAPVFILMLPALAIIIWRDWMPLVRMETLMLVTVSAMPLSRQLWLYHFAGAAGEEWLRLLGNTYWATSAVLVLIFTIGDRQRGLRTGTAVVLISVLIAIIGTATGLARNDLPAGVITYIVGSLLFLTLFLVLMSVATIMRDQWHTAISRAAVYSRWALTDKLTGLANRRAGMDLLARECATTSRHNRPLSIIMGDLDNFKQVNDTAGHAAGDAVLRGVADIFLSTIRQSDVVVRWGGEEFLIITVDTNLEEARTLAERCRGAIETDSITGVRMTMTFGIAQYRNGDTEESLLARADANLYTGKKSGANQVVAEANPIMNA